MQGEYLTHNPACNGCVVDISLSLGPQGASHHACVACRMVRASLAAARNHTAIFVGFCSRITKSFVSLHQLLPPLAQTHLLKFICRVLQKKSSTLALTSSYPTHAPPASGHFVATRVVDTLDPPNLLHASPPRLLPSPCLHPPHPTRAFRRKNGGVSRGSAPL